MKIAFTICTFSYLGLAEVLARSLDEHDQDTLFLTFIVDGCLNEARTLFNFDRIVEANKVLRIPSIEWIEMAFKYDVTEFCTAIKPACFKYIFQNFQCDACIYLDPDILVFDNLKCLYDQLTRKSIILTPHIATIQTTYSGDLSEKNLLYSGIYNLGFLGLKNCEISMRMLDWWDIRLKDRCYQSMSEHYFTDQKWMDFIPGFFPNDVLILPNLGLNLAPWNFFEREVIFDGGRAFVRNRLDEKSEPADRLKFAHFSGFNYRDLAAGRVSQGNILDLRIPKDIGKLIDIYANKLKCSNVSDWMARGYYYNRFSNSVNVSTVHRRLYRRLLEDARVSGDPFNSDGEFYAKLTQHGLVDVAISDSKMMISAVSRLWYIMLIVNLCLRFIHFAIGTNRFFLAMRVLRLYSIVENHVYLIDKRYLREVRLRR
jgi:hypothetical protein